MAATIPSTKHEFPAFEDLLARVRADSMKRWADLESDFIETVEGFDHEFSSGKQPKGWYQAKARYFNDLVVQLLVNQSGKDVSRRCKRRSQLFDLIDIDICYPPEGDPQVAGEVKALGTPPHPGNDSQARAGAADLHKRIREVAFTSMDLKASYATPTPIASLQQWIDKTSPGYFAFWAIRAADEADLNKVRGMLNNLRNYCNGVGAVIYGPKSVATPTVYQAKRIPELSIDKAIREMSQRVA